MQDNISESVKVQWKLLFQELRLRCPYSVSIVFCLQHPPQLSLCHKQFCFSIAVPQRKCLEVKYSIPVQTSEEVICSLSSSPPCSHFAVLQSSLLSLHSRNLWKEKHLPVGFGCLLLLMLLKM